MRIAFLDFTSWNYSPDTAYSQPLGGSQSALCYLAEQLALADHEVYLLNQTPELTVSRGVICVPIAKARADLLRSLDALVVQNLADRGPELRDTLGPTGKLILWTQHADDQPAMRALEQPRVRYAYDGYALVSDWQRGCYERQFGIDPARSCVLRNAVGPAFEALLAAGPENISLPAWPPILAYTSTPFRGLDMLLDVFPRIRQAVPGATLRVYSSMRVYHVGREQDESQYGELYRRCHETVGVQYVGSLAQPTLAAELRSANVLAYPNHFAETSCISVMEALAAGLRVVTSNLGALQETCAGFGKLVPWTGDRPTYEAAFVSTLLEVLETSNSIDIKQLKADRAAQIAHVQAECTWKLRAPEWIDWLSSIAPRRSMR